MPTVPNAACSFTQPSYAAYRKAKDHWLADLIQETADCTRPLHPAIQNFRHFIETNIDMHILFSEMFMPAQSRMERFLSNTLRLPGADELGSPEVRNYNHMLELLNSILTRGPKYRRTGIIDTLPILVLFRQIVKTPTAAAVFLDKRVNEQIRMVLNAWGEFLSSSESCAVLNTDPRTGWLGKDAMEAMPNFDQHFDCDPQAPHYGFRSWDDFFTRRLKLGARPLTSPDDDSVVVNACESAPHNLAHNVQRIDRFWIKGRPYSLKHMLANDDLTEQFIGGTVYQAFLSPTNYHRWHSPVSGRIIKAYVKSGTYYWRPALTMKNSRKATDSNRYLVETATRAMIFIQADNSKIGLMCFMPVGMAEVSTCQITVQEGQQVKKGEELGMFHYGGSTYCLLFRPETKLSFDFHNQTPGPSTKNILVNEKIATVLVS